MKYLDSNDNLGDAECSNDAIQSSDLLTRKLAEHEAVLQSARGAKRIKPLLDSGYILLDLVGRKQEAWALAREALEIALAEENWLSAVEACDIIYQAEQEDAVLALAHGIWLGVTYPIDPELSVAMLQHLVDETPPDSDGAAVAAATAVYIVDLRAEGTQRDELGFFTNQMMGAVARRHTNGACDTQELFDIWIQRLELNDPAKFLPRLSKIVDILVPQGQWWFDRDALREKIPAQ
ncbi:MAG: hypothetical protein OQL08_08685 [Gammaproteobacteria bacterium]|nr:hypothetical protein [Gammaproteobacteria bacterium]